MTDVVLAYDYFPDPKVGRPVFFGEVYIGVPDDDPTIPANQIEVTLIDEQGNGTVVSQPLKTGAGGIIDFNGSAARITVAESNYSVAVLNEKGKQVYYSPQARDPANEKELTDLPAIGSITGANIFWTKDPAGNDVSATAAQIAAQGTSIASEVKAAPLGSSNPAIVDVTDGNKIKQFTQDDFADAIPPRNAATLTTLEPSDLVIVGDVSDKNIHKGMTQSNFKTALNIQGGFVPFLGVTTAEITFPSANTWQTLLIDAGRANKWVWIVCDMPEGTDNSTVYFRNGTQGIGQLPEYVIGRVTGNSIGSLLSMPVQLDPSGNISVNSTRSGITVRYTMRGEWPDA